MLPDICDVPHFLLSERIVAKIKIENGSVFKRVAKLDRIGLNRSKIGSLKSVLQKI